MKTRYKIGRFSHSVCVCPGDQLNLTLTERDGTKQKVSEEIQITATITHWVMFYVPGVGFGGMFGGPDIGSKMPEIFVNPERINDEDLLIGETP
jgi:hypothetical protein